MESTFDGFASPVLGLLEDELVDEPTPPRPPRPPSAA